MKLGVLSYQDYENWRFHRIPYLEKVCKTNLSKLTLIMKELKTYAVENQLCRKDMERVGILLPTSK